MWTAVAEVLGRELARPSWGRHPVALGTNTDPYQRAEGRYRLMPAILAALRAVEIIWASPRELLDVIYSIDRGQVSIVG